MVGLLNLTWIMIQRSVSPAGNATLADIDQNSGSNRNMPAAARLRHIQGGANSAQHSSFSPKPPHPCPAPPPGPA